MSRETALANIRLEPCGRWGHTEYSLEYHRAYLSERTGLAPDDRALFARAYDRFGFDFLWSTHDGLIDWAATGRTTDMGHAVYAADGSDLHPPGACPFRSEDEVWAFDAVAEYGLPDFDEQVRAYDEQLARTRAAHPGQLATGGYYRTIVSGAIAAFGWEMLLLAAADTARMERVFDGFFRRTKFFMEAWAKTSVEVVIQHDDFVWSAGPFLHPEVYRKAIIPRYGELWKPLRAAGKKVLFCSDAYFLDLAEDLVAAGADGLIFEPCNSWEAMAERFGSSTCLVGSAVDCRDLASGRWDKVERDLDRTFAALARCRGAIIAVGNHLPPDIPPDMLDRYFAALLPRLVRA